MPGDAIHVHTQGLKELRGALRALEPAADRMLRDELRHAGEKIAVTAGALAPHRTGDLAHSIRAYVLGARVSVGSTLPYAGVVHWGGTIEPRGVPIHFRRTEFIVRAAEDHADELVNDIAEGVDRVTRSLGWR
jgi:phage gpG-like protein